MLFAALCVISGGCGGGGGGPLNNSDSTNPDVEALNNKTFESADGATGTGTAKDANGNTVNVTLSDVFLRFTNVAASAASVQVAATTGTVWYYYVLTIGTTSQDYTGTWRDVEFTEESSGVYAFSSDGVKFTIDPSSGKVTLGGKFKFNGTEYTFDNPIEIGVSENESASTPVTNTNVNDLWNGGWIYQSGVVSADSNGTEIGFNVLQLAVYMQDCNVSEDEGTATLSSIFIVSADPTLQGVTAHLRLPAIFDEEAATTTRTDDYAWTATTEHGVFNIDINPDTEIANLTGYTHDTSFDMSFDVVMAKYTATGTVVNVEEALEGQTWASSYDNMNKNGGFISSPALNGFAFMSNGAINSVFNNVEMKSDGTGTAHITTAAMLPARAFLSATQSFDIILPYISSVDITLENIFGSIYKFEVPSAESIQPTKGVLIFEPTDTDQATIIINSATVAQSAGISAMFHMKKSTGTEVDIQSAAADAVWTANVNYPAGGILYSKDMGVPFAPIVMSTDNPFEVNLDADFTAKTITISVDGDFSVTGTNRSVNVGDLLTRITGEDTLKLEVQKIGFNTLYAESDKSRFVFVLLGEENGILFAEIAPTGNKSQEVCSISGIMDKNSEQ